MASKNTTQVLIGGKIYTMSGYESEEYLQRVAAYLNNKITQIKTAEGYARMSSDMRALLLNLNTADDYFKLKEKSDQLSESLSAKDKELYEIKHELIQTQMRLENLTKELKNEKDSHRADQRELTQMRYRQSELKDFLDMADTVEDTEEAAETVEVRETQALQETQTVETVRETRTDVNVEAAVRTMASRAAETEDAVEAEETAMQGDEIQSQHPDTADIIGDEEPVNGVVKNTVERRIEKPKKQKYNRYYRR